MANKDKITAIAIGTVAGCSICATYLTGAIPETVCLIGMTGIVAGSYFLAEHKLNSAPVRR